MVGTTRLWDRTRLRLLAAAGVYALALFVVAGVPALAVAGLLAATTESTTPTEHSVRVLLVGLAWVLFAAGLLWRAWPAIRHRLVDDPAHLVRGRAPDAERANLDGTLLRLAQQVDIEPPALRVVDRRAPVCYSVRWTADTVPGSVPEDTEFDAAGPSTPSPWTAEYTLVVSTGVLDALSEAEQRAVLAHEIAHCANDDFRLLHALLVPLVVADELVEGVRTVDFETGRRDRTRAAPDPGRGVRPDIAVIEAIARVTRPVGRCAISLAAPTRELAADDAAVAITGAPAALASALETLDQAAGPPATDLREQAALNVSPVVTARGPLAGARTHPPTAHRVERLRERVEKS